MYDCPYSLILVTNHYARAPMWRLSEQGLAAGQKDRAAQVSLLFICVSPATSITENISPEKLAFPSFLKNSFQFLTYLQTKIRIKN